ncbi:MAG: FtsX-like permease family protein [Thermoproteota archaeon]
MGEEALAWLSLKRMAASLTIMLLLLLSLAPERTAIGNGEEGWKARMMEETIPRIVSSINFANIAGWREIIANYSRFVGTDGYYGATEFIFNKLREFAPEAYLENFTVVVPVNRGANISVGGKVLRLYPLLPNWAAPCTTLGESGKLVYVGRGEAEELDGKEIKGSIVVMDFNSGYNWLTVAALGAKAIIFLEPNDTTYSESMMKYVDSPVKILRFYIRGDDARQLVEECNRGIEGKVVSSQVWEEREAYNIIGFIEGKRRDEIVAFFTYYDSFSVVPDLAYDKDAAGNPAAWLEIARYFSLNRPERSLLFVAFSGHYQYLRGVAAFLNNVFKNLTYARQFAERIKIALAIDLSTESPAALVTYGIHMDLTLPIEIFPVNSRPLYKAGVFRGSDKLLFRGGREIKYNESWAVRTGNVKLGDESLLVLMSEAMRGKVSRDPPYLIGDGLDRVDEYGGGYKTVLRPMATSRLETAMFMTATGRVSLTLLSALTKREKWNTPLTTDVFNLENLKPNVEFITCALHVYANEVGINIYREEESKIFEKSITFETVFETGFEEAYGMGFPKIVGHVMVWDESIGNYKPMGNALVIIGTWSSDPIIVKADEKGDFEVAGIRGYGGQQYETFYGGTSRGYFGSAFVINETSGDIVYASDSGPYGHGAGPLFFENFQVEKLVKTINLVVFKCGSLVLFEPIDPIRLKLTDELSFSVNDALTHVNELHFGLPMRYLIRVYTLSRYCPFLERQIPPCYPLPVFVPVDTLIEVVAYARAKPVGIVSNGGKGYVLKPGESEYIFAPEAFSSDLFEITSERLKRLEDRYVFSGGRRVEDENSAIGMYVNLMEEGFKHSRYSEYMLYAYKTLYRGLKSYESGKEMYFDTAGTAVILLLLLLPFAFFLERLFFQASGFKRMLILIGMIVIFTCTIYSLHPGFEIVSGFYIMLLGVLAILLFIPALIMLQSQLSHELRVEREKRMGVHETPIDRLSAVVLSLSYGINSMRKRGFRIALTLTSVIIFIFSLVLLTTAYSYVSESMREKSPAPEMKPAFNGLMLEAALLEVPTTEVSHWLLSASALRYINLSLQMEFGNVKIYPRVDNPFNFLSTVVAGTYASTCTHMFVNGELRFNLSYPIKSVYGLPADEPKLGLWNASRYVNPPGAWFSSDDSLECIVAEEVAKNYGIKLGDYISFSTSPSFRVVGILNGSRLKSDDPKEINGQSIAPTHQNVEDWRMAWAQVEAGLGLPKTYSSFVILPWKTLLNTYGGTIRRIVVPLDVFNENVKAYASYASLESNTDITVSDRDGSKIYFFSKGLLASSSGFDIVLVPMAMVLAILSSTIYGNLYERRRDVYITSVVGASPMSVIFMFLGESLIYSVLGSFLGYLLALSALRLLIGLVGLETIVQGGIAMNYGSSYVGAAVLLSFVVTVSASLMPIMRIITIAAPSLRRKWKAAKPKGNRWEVPLPVDVMERDVYGITAYIWEFMSVHSGDVLSLFNIADKRFLTVEEMGVHKVKAIYLLNMLPPERGVSQELAITYAWNPKRQMYSTTVVMTRKQGEVRDWTERGTRLLDHLRRQHLLWRSLDEKTRNEYIRRGREMLKE